jgi:hypothetical protein|tara:strand:+ start:829 stop:1569 length:741 start_codon:yes stop_codon:yes gene_type:complete
MAVSSTTVAIGDTVLASDYNELRTDVVNTSTGHIHDASDSAEIDGDHLDIDFTPSNYTPDSSPAEAADVDDLAAHLKGLDTISHASSHAHSTHSGIAIDDHHDAPRESTGTSQTVNNSTTFVNAPGMNVAVSANKQYLVIAFIHFESNSTADIKFQLTGPSGFDNSGAVVKKDASDALVHDKNNSVGYDWVVSGATSPDKVTLIWLVEVAGTAGTVQLQFAQQAATVVNTVVRSDGNYFVAIPLEG